MKEYKQLPTAPTSLGDEEQEAVIYEEFSRWDKYLIRITCVCATLSTVLALSVYLSSSPPSLKITDTLRRPSPYPGLGRVLSEEKHDPLGPITSLSQMLLQISVGDSSRRMTEDTSRQHDTSRGTVYPDDRHFIASREASTIVQFKTLDYGMERCILHATFPNRTKELNPAIEVAPFSTINVWRLDRDHEISPRNPDSWKYAPNRKSLLALFDFPSSGTWSSKEFNCDSLSFVTLEFACASSNCHVEFWQDRISPNGIYLEQFDSTTKAKSQ
ncbi:hypothetical protein FA15DRAFT_462935 [Coprinopsis marcescibilis]|uniref:Ubiquitin 3 binding protein But2 C-terminal domain-containing protein n=1 Tax=Coprinopsis marcescibilis TaxID=230819 RepID=A0A5C3KSM2_COPMA|nr:hypothetical protein FA15DRAFT_462935 [Coprinopsis marcescibilis]